MTSATPHAEPVRAPENVPCSRLVVFVLDDHRYAVPLAAAERVVPAVEITPLPAGPAIVLGIFNLQGRLVPVFDVRARFRLPPKPVAPEQQFLVARAGNWSVALPVDATLGVVDVPESETVPSGKILADLPFVQGVVRTTEGLVLIHDLNTFLALDEAASLERALSTHDGGPCVE